MEIKKKTEPLLHALTFDVEEVYIRNHKNTVNYVWLQLCVYVTTLVILHFLYNHDDNILYEYCEILVFELL